MKSRLNIKNKINIIGSHRQHPWQHRQHPWLVLYTPDASCLDSRVGHEKKFYDSYLLQNPLSLGK